MAVGTVTLFDNAIQDFMDGSMSLWTASTWYGNLYGTGSTNPLTNFTTRGDITHTELTTADYTRYNFTATTIAGTAPQTNFASEICNFGASVSLTAKWFVVTLGTAGSADKLLFFVNLDTTDVTTTTVSSTSAAFTIDDAANGWFYIS